MTERLLARARAGDGDAFAELMAPFRRELQVHCYRILGSTADAEDMLQETMMAAWRGPEARYETRESVSLAFVAALQQLPPRQRAVLVLRDALGFRAAETADILGCSLDAANNALRRARATIERELPPGWRDRSPLRDRRMSARSWTGSPGPSSAATSMAWSPCLPPTPG